MSDPACLVSSSSAKSVDMDRLEQFEKMLADLQKQAEEEYGQMEALKAAGKEKTATYRQYFANRLMYLRMLERYRQYGLLDQ